MRTLNLIAGAAVIALASAFSAGSAKADLWSWDTDSLVGANNTVNLGNQITDTPAGIGTLTAQGLQIVGNSNKLTTGLTNARLFNFSGECCGLGVTNTVENPGSGLQGSVGAPDHTVSNEIFSGSTQVTDVVAFQLPTVTGTQWTVNNLTIHEFNGSNGGKGNLTVLVGGTSSTTLASISGMSITALEAAGFHLLQYNNGTNNTTDGTEITITDTTKDATNQTLGQFTGSMLLVAASINDTGTSQSNSDYFKIGEIGGSRPTTQVPEPGTLVIFGAGLAGLIVLRRRQSKTAA